MSDLSVLPELQGGKTVVDWFGRIPRFHDAEIFDIRLSQCEPCSLQLHAWNITDVVDRKGFFVTEKHALVTISFVKVHTIRLHDFDFGSRGIVSQLEFAGSITSTEVRWNSAVGVNGLIRGSGVSLSVCPNNEMKG